MLAYISCYHSDYDVVVAYIRLATIVLVTSDIVDVVRNIGGFMQRGHEWAIKNTKPSPQAS